MGLAVLIDRPGYRLATDSKVIKRAEAAIVDDVSRAYALATERIDTAFRATDAACAEITRQAYAQGEAAARQDIARRFTTMELDRKALLLLLQPVLADVVVNAVALVARSIDRESLVARAMELLQASLRDVAWARLRVHPDTVLTAQRALDELCRETGIGRIARVTPDESLPPDGCVLETELGTVDASLETQLNAISEALSSAAHRIVDAAGA